MDTIQTILVKIIIGHLEFAQNVITLALTQQKVNLLLQMVNLVITLSKHVITVQRF